MEGAMSNGCLRRKLSPSQKGKAIAGDCNSSPNPTADLPDHTLRRILSFLSVKDAARASAVSRRWRALSSIRESPVVRFDADEILRYSRALGHFSPVDPSTSRQFDDFVCLVDSYFDQEPVFEIKDLALRFHHGPHGDLVEGWLETAGMRGVEKIHLDCAAPRDRSPHYMVRDLPCNLRALSLTHCKVVMKTAPAASNTLTSISLEDVDFPEFYWTNGTEFISSFPLLEHLSLVNCNIQHLAMTRPAQNLKSVRIINCCRYIKMCADNLVRLELSRCFPAFLHLKQTRELDRVKPPSRLFMQTNCIIFTPDPDLGGFGFLKSLALCGAMLQDGLRSLLGNCHALVDLSFEDCRFPKVLVISGLAHLESLKIVNSTSPKTKVRVCATNLKTFIYVGEASYQLLHSNADAFSPLAGRGSALEHLHLKGGELSISIPSFSCIKTVILNDLHLRDGRVEELLARCSLLEKVQIEDCNGLGTLKIAGPFLKLRYLSVVSCPSLLEIEICAAELMEFKYDGPLVCFSMREVPQLATVDIRIEANYNEISTNYVLNMLAKDVPQLHKLIYHIEDVMLPGAMPMFLTLKNLVLFFGIQKHSLVWATRFLAASPLVDKFEMQMPRFFTLSCVDKRWREWRHHHLKEAYLFAFRGCKKEMQMAEDVTHNAKNLELLRIDPRPMNSSCVPGDWLQCEREKTLRLLSKEARPGVQLVIL